MLVLCAQNQALFPALQIYTIIDSKRRSKFLHNQRVFFLRLVSNKTSHNNGKTAVDGYVVVQFYPWFKFYFLLF